MKSLRSAILAVSLGLAPLSAFAVPINFSFHGTVDTALDGNAFGLGVGDLVTVSGMFDDVLTGTGSETVFFNLGSGNTLEIEVGLLTYNETDDVEFTGAFPTLSFLDGLLSGFNFSAQSPPEFFTGTTMFAGDRIAPGVDCSIVTNCGITGTWNLGSFTTSVPNPGTLALLAIGLAAGVWARRRKFA